MFSSEIEREARLTVPGFIGVFPLDHLPQFYTSRPKVPYRFIVNTQTVNLPGEHWLGISYEENGIVLAFDPLGFYYPSSLVEYLLNTSRKVYFNYHQYQKPGTTVCGQMCVAFLKSLKCMSVNDMISRFVP